ncbi:MULTISPECIES: MmcQ/YjbR family DNA-binding protein [Microbacterium]|uniref:MmcQ/YjbR family DNA-binding protein n=1 Tax=Microbacterium TaxID=33882 RepID=UPI00217CD779|nr:MULTISPECIES: hypothetical protein [Microbacterium]UWF78024.1 hypothetical protein JSY13_02990 [Microbacterium neungamense]WCM56202.1 hypothetical protein JRG78_03015 [Microbacterium sp. EF45047]
MPTIDDVRRIALGLPGVFEKTEGHLRAPAWYTRGGLVVWERPPGKKDLAQLAEAGGSWPSGTVVAARVDGPDVKAALLETYPEVFFTIPHFDGYPAVLIRLDAIDDDLLRETIVDAWLLRAPRRIASEWLAEHGSDESMPQAE